MLGGDLLEAREEGVNGVESGGADLSKDDEDVVEDKVQVEGEVRDDQGGDCNSGEGDEEALHTHTARDRRAHAVSFALPLVVPSLRSG